MVGRSPSGSFSNEQNFRLIAAYCPCPNETKAAQDLYTTSTMFFCRPAPTNVPHCSVLSLLPDNSLTLGHWSSAVALEMAL